MVLGIRRSDQPSRGARRRPALALAAVFALLFQTFVTQTHFHAPGVPGAAQATQAAQAEASAVHLESRQPQDHQPACVICETMAAAGAAVLSSGAESLLFAGVGVLTRAPAPPLAPRAYSHSWRSRAPPSVL
jgi:hypothetical protein